MTTRKVISVFLLAVTLLFSAQKTSYAEPASARGSGPGGWIAAGVLGVVAIVEIIAVSVNNGDQAYMHPCDLDRSLDDETSYDEEDAVDGTDDTSLPSDVSTEVQVSSIQNSQIQSASVPVVNTMSDSELM